MELTGDLTGSQVTALEELEKRTHSNWEHLRAARQRSQQEAIEITSALKKFPYG